MLGWTEALTAAGIETAIVGAALADETSERRPTEDAAADVLLELARPGRPRSSASPT